MSQMTMNRASDKIASGRLLTRPCRRALCVNAAARPSVGIPVGYTSSAATIAALAQALPAAALENFSVDPQPPGAVDTTVDQLVAFLRSTGASIKGGVDVVGSGVKTVQEGYSTAEPFLKQGINTVGPIVRQAFGAAGSVAEKVGTAAAPILKESVKEAEVASGFHISDVLNVVAGVATTGARVVGPLVNGAVYVATTNSPVTLAEYGLAAYALTLASPYVTGFVAGGFRGYAGEVSSVAAVDLLLNGNALLVDLRTKKEKETSGVPDLPSTARDRMQEVEFATTEDRKLRGALRDAFSVEAQVTALQVSALRRVHRSTTVLLLDRDGGNAAAVAKELTAKGFRKVFVVSGGMDGRNGWLQSKLQIKPSAGDVTPFTRSTRGNARKQLSASRFLG